MQIYFGFCIEIFNLSTFGRDSVFAYTDLNTRASSHLRILLLRREKRLREWARAAAFHLYLVRVKSRLGSGLPSRSRWSFPHEIYVKTAPNQSPPDSMGGTTTCSASFSLLKHRVGRVITFSPVVRIGTLPTPHPQASAPPPLVRVGGGTLAGERGCGRVLFSNSNEGTYTVVLFIYCIRTLCFEDIFHYLDKPSSCGCRWTEGWKDGKGWRTAAAVRETLPAPPVLFPVQQLK